MSEGAELLAGVVAVSAVFVCICLSGIGQRLRYIATLLEVANKLENRKQNPDLYD